MEGFLRASAAAVNTLSIKERWNSYGIKDYSLDEHYESPDNHMSNTAVPRSKTTTEPSSKDSAGLQEPPVHQSPTPSGDKTTETLSSGSVQILRLLRLMTEQMTTLQE